MYSQSGHLSLVDKAKKTYEMGYTLDEFSKTLHGQFVGKQSGYHCQQVSNTQWLIKSTEGFAVKITVSSAPQRKIAMLSIPVLRVNFSFQSQDKMQKEQFLKRFFSYFHKGGG